MPLKGPPPEAPPTSSTCRDLSGNAGKCREMSGNVGKCWEIKIMDHLFCHDFANYTSYERRVTDISQHSPTCREEMSASGWRPSGWSTSPHVLMKHNNLPINLFRHRHSSANHRGLFRLVHQVQFVRVIPSWVPRHHCEGPREGKGGREGEGGGSDERYTPPVRLRLSRACAKISESNVQASVTSPKNDYNAGRKNFFVFFFLKKYLYAVDWKFFSQHGH